MSSPGARLREAMANGMVLAPFVYDGVTALIAEEEHDFTIDEKLRVEDYRIPPMLMQPYIENSIWHGLRYMDMKGKLNVSIEDAGQRGLGALHPGARSRRREGQWGERNFRFA